jgi:hypothetical protein
MTVLNEIHTKRAIKMSVSSTATLLSALRESTSSTILRGYNPIHPMNKRPKETFLGQSKKKEILGRAQLERKKAVSSLNYIMRLHNLSVDMFPLFRPLIQQVHQIFLASGDSYLKLAQITAKLDEPGSTGYNEILHLLDEIDLLNQQTYRDYGFFIQSYLVASGNIACRIDTLAALENKIIRIEESSDQDQELKDRDLDMLRRLHYLESTILECQNDIDQYQTISPEKLLEINQVEQVYLNQLMQFQSARLLLDQAMSEYSVAIHAKQDAKTSSTMVIEVVEEVADNISLVKPRK